MARRRRPGSSTRIPNKGDWYVAALVERFERRDADRSNPRRRGWVWENLVLIHAPDLAAAYDKAVALGKQCEADDTWRDGQGQPCRQVFEGVAALLPVYEDLEDGAEVMWTDHGVITAARAKRMVRSKRQLLKSDTKSKRK